MPTKKILNLVSSVNIAKDLSKKQLDEISELVTKNYNADKESMSSWLRDAKKAIKLAGMRGTYNDKEELQVKSPLVSRACINFASNTVPEFIRDGKICKAKIYGKDVDNAKQERAKREVQYLNYLLLNPNSSWQESFEKTLTQLACVGMSFRKAVYDPRTKECKTIFLSYDEVFLHNKCKSLDPGDCRSITHKYKMHLNELVSMERQGIFTNIPKEDDRDGIEERDGYFDIVEQHCFYDADDDGYEEPYIVTKCESSGGVLRMVSRYSIEDVIYNEDNEVVEIIPEQYFIPYIYLPSFDGSFFGLGIGNLLTSITTAFDSSINMLIAKGRQSNLDTYFIDKSTNFKQSKIELGKANVIDTGGVDIDKVVKKIELGEASPVLMELAKWLETFAKELSTTTDVMTGGDMPSNMKTGAANLMIERGMKVFNAIHKRTFKSVTTELNIIYKLIHRYEDLNKYAAVLDEPVESLQGDFVTSNMDVYPIADPNMASEAHRAMRTEYLLQISQDPRFPEENVFNIYREGAEARGFENVDRFIPNVEQAKQDPKVVELRQQAEQQMQQLQQAQQQFDLERAKLDEKVKSDERNFTAKMTKIQAEVEESVRKHVREVLKEELRAEIEKEKISEQRRQATSGN